MEISKIYDRIVGSRKFTELRVMKILTFSSIKEPLKWGIKSEKKIKQPIKRKYNSTFYLRLHLVRNVMKTWCLFRNLHVRRKEAPWKKYCFVSTIKLFNVSWSTDFEFVNQSIKFYLYYFSCKQSYEKRNCVCVCVCVCVCFCVHCISVWLFVCICIVFRGSDISYWSLKGTCQVNT